MPQLLADDREQGSARLPIPVAVGSKRSSSTTSLFSGHNGAVDRLELRPSCGSALARSAMRPPWAAAPGHGEDVVIDFSPGLAATYLAASPRFSASCTNESSIILDTSKPLSFASFLLSTAKPSASWSAVTCG